MGFKMNGRANDYTIGDWVMAGWSTIELVRKAEKDGWTAKQVIEWCIDHADDAAQEAEVRALPGYDELVEILTGMIDGARPTLPDLVAAAGYYRIDMARLLADLREKPGCAKVSERMLFNYLHGKTKLPAAVGIALSAMLGADLEIILRGSKC